VEACRLVLPGPRVSAPKTLPARSRLLAAAISIATAHVLGASCRLDEVISLGRTTAAWASDRQDGPKRCLGLLQNIGEKSSTTVMPSSIFTGQIGGMSIRRRLLLTAANQAT
jgi:precorrin-6B methylase 1